MNGRSVDRLPTRLRLGRAVGAVLALGTSVTLAGPLGGGRLAEYACEMGVAARPGSARRGEGSSAPPRGRP